MMQVRTGQHCEFSAFSADSDRNPRELPRLLPPPDRVPGTEIDLALRRNGASLEVHFAGGCIPVHVVLGGEPAADLLTHYLKPGTVTLYVRDEHRPLNEIVARHRLRTDPAGEVEVLEAFWPARIVADQPGLAPTPLIYADLLATGDARCIETAQIVYDDYLARRFTQA